MSAKVLQARFSRLQNAIVEGNWESAWLDSNVMCILTDGNNNDHHDAKNLLTRHSCSLKTAWTEKKNQTLRKLGGLLYQESPLLLLLSTVPGKILQNKRRKLGLAPATPPKHGGHV